MKKIAILAPVSPGKTAGVNAPTQFGICIVEETHPPAPSPAAPTASSATARRVDKADVPAKPGSVVAKVAKLLTSRGHELRLEHPAGWQDGYVQQKVLVSLQAKQSL
jgi:hypothetical protein